MAARAGVSSEAASWASGAAAFAGLACLLLPVEAALWPGICLLFLFNFLDCVDGDLSRVLNTRNPYGRFLDSIMGWADMLFWGAAGVAAWRIPGLRAALPAEACLWAGATAAFMYVYAAYLERVFDEVLRPSWEAIGTAAGIVPSPSPLAGRNGPSRWLRIASSNLRVRETHYVLFAAACAVGAADLLICSYAVFNAAVCAVLLISYCRRGSKVRAAAPGSGR